MAVSLWDHCSAGTKHASYQRSTTSHIYDFPSSKVNFIKMIIFIVIVCINININQRFKTSHIYDFPFSKVDFIKMIIIIVIISINIIVISALQLLTFMTSTSLKLILSKLSNSFPVKTSYDLL